MAEVILMPRLSDTMTEGVIAAWHKKIGDAVKKGDLLAEVETDKATMELESYKDGTLLHIGIDKGGKLQVNDLLAIIGAPGEDISSLIKGAGKSGDGSQETEDTQKTEVKAEKKEAATQKQDPKPPTSNIQPQTSSLDISKMDEVVLMPRLSDTMEEGVIAGWNKNVGDAVKKGEVLAEIETDKATMELESYKNGTLLYIGAQKGEKIPVNALLCIIGEKGKVDVDAIVAALKGGASPMSEVRSREPVSESSKASAGTATIQSKETSAQPQTSNNQQQSTNNGRLKASPLAKRLAKEKGIDIQSIHGSGDGGRIIKSDIDNYKASAPTAASDPSKPLPVFLPVAGEEGHTDIPNTQIRNIIAKRLAESKFSAPHFYLTMEINMDNCISARTQLNEVSPVKISFNDMVVKAAALALRQHPAVNASWLGDKIRRHHHIHIGIAVAIEDGLIVPVIRFADQKELPQIAAESKELAGKAKNKKLQPNEFTGNTFTISNLGMMDIDEFTAIINPPDSCIMAVGRIKERVIKRGESFVSTNVMKITLSCDHRSVDGATGAAFLQTFKKFLENPVSMLLK
ncbi:MAG TPA: pyruvate dehydrogenase complex dihydrolipoamide acetyltransferase [Chitinophagaceae bacterium]|nr:pyruvate dehydrogenase complex dihydrolipoamide acetyltransferase [Chitinophagaceae bacterium]